MTGSARRVAIVGGGPGGLTLAAALLKQGCRVDLYERRPVIEPIGSGISLSPPPLVVLERLGVDIAALGVATDFEFARHDGKTRTGIITSPALEARFGLMVISLLRPTLHAALLKVLPPECLHAGRELERFEDAGDHVALHFADGGRARADVLVGADGLHSVVRRQLWGDALREHHLVCYQGYASWRGLPDREGQILHDKCRQFGHMPLRLPDGLGRQWWFIERGEAGGPLAPGTRDRIAGILRNGGWRPQLAELVAATDERTLLRRDITDRAPLKRWSRGRATLLGDAAHPTSPYAGYGAGMAIEDGWVLATLLAAADLRDTSAVAGAFAEYEKQRLKKTAQVSQLAWTLGRTFHSHNRFVQAIRDGFLDGTPLGGLGISRGYLSSLEQEMKRI